MLELAFRSLSWVWAMHFLPRRQATNVRTRREEALARRSPCCARSAAGSHRAHTCQRTSSEYTSARRGPGALCDGPRRAASCRQAAVFARVSAGGSYARRSRRQIAPDGGHHGAIDALPPVHARLLHARVGGGAALPRDPVHDLLADAVRPLSRQPRASSPTIDGRLPHIGDDDGGQAGALHPIGRRMMVRDSLAIASVLVHRGRPPDWRGHRGGILVRSDIRRSSRRSTAQASARRMARFLLRCPSPIPATTCRESATAPSRRRGRSARLPLGGGHAHADALSVDAHGRWDTVAHQIREPGCYTVGHRAARSAAIVRGLHNTVDGRRPGRSPFRQVRFLFRGSAPPQCRRARLAGRARSRLSSRPHTTAYAPLRHRRHVLALHGDQIVRRRPAVRRGLSRRHSCTGICDPRWRADAHRPPLHAPRARERGQSACRYCTGHARLFQRRKRDRRRSRGSGWHAPCTAALETASDASSRADGLRHRSGRAPFSLCLNPANVRSCRLPSSAVVRARPCSRKPLARSAWPQGPVPPRSLRHPAPARGADRALAGEIFLRFGLCVTSRMPSSPTPGRPVFLAGAANEFTEALAARRRDVIRAVDPGLSRIGEATHTSCAG